MKRAHRLRRPNQFQRVRREGRTHSHYLLRLTIVDNRRKHTRCGIVTSKHIGRAVQRNRAKRRVREAVRLVFTHISRGVDLVFVVRTAAVNDVPFARLQQVVSHLLHRAGVWHDSPASPSDTSS